MTEYSILVVDDEPDNFEVIEALLPSDKYALHYASRGEDAIACLNIFKPDAILLDVMMPDVDGIEVCKRIKAMTIRQAIPIIMITALSGKEDLARCLEAGADDFICKPVSGIELRARVNSMLRLKQQYDRIRSLSKLQNNSIALLKNSLNEIRGSLDFTFPNELNVSLHSILGNIQQLNGKLDNLNSEEVKSLLSNAQGSAQRLDRSTRKLLMYLNLALEAPQPRIADRCLAQPIIEEIAQRRARQAGRPLDLILDVENAELQVSDDRLQWLVDELLDNAFKFSPEDTTVEVRGQLIDNTFHLWVIDQGSGLSEDSMDRSGDLSELSDYKQCQPNEAESGIGVGLGLKIVKKIVESYAGLFLVSSIYQHQTTVHITLPLASMVSRR
jgi:two-component system, sensor histidine kinase and response regulator